MRAPFSKAGLTEDDLAHYRQELRRARGARGLSSYPHPWLMPDFWQFPTGSMGIGPISSIYQARFMRYLQHRGLLDCRRAHASGACSATARWTSPRSMSALTLAAREKLDNLMWVINCNLQRLDGPVRGNGHIIDELEALFAGAGWNVDQAAVGLATGTACSRATPTARWRARSRDTVDGQYPDLRAPRTAATTATTSSARTRSSRALAQGMTDEQIDRLKRGGHDLVQDPRRLRRGARAPRASRR